MDQIVAPLRRSDHGAAVRNLQDALLTLSAADAPDAGDEQRETRVEALRREREESVYGDATAETVARFQREESARLALPDSSGAQVDVPTAAALNGLLRRLGMIQHGTEDACVLRGRVELEDGSPLAG